MADALGEFLLAGYRFCGSLVRPVVPLVLRARVARGKEDAARTGERYGIASARRPEGRVIWVHAASVGETNAVLPLVHRLSKAGFPVLFTTTTITSAQIAAANLPANAVHQFGPLDVPAYVDRFLKHWRPYFVIFAESELWPTIMASLEAAVVPLVIVNGRMSDRSYRGWRRLGGATKALFSRIGLCLAQSAEDAARFRSLGAEKVEIAGNLKFDTPPLIADQADVARLKALIGSRPVWVAASTHEGEEEIVAAAHRIIAGQRENLLTVIVPRHPPRGAAVRDLLVASGFSVARRSRGEALLPETEVYLADTLGELGLFYRAAPVAFLGGSLVAVGGHNPIEPVRLGCAVLHGPHVHNFAELFALLDQVAPGAQVDDAASLADALLPMIDHPARAEQTAGAVAAAFAPLSGALDATMTALQPYLSGKYYSP